MCSSVSITHHNTRDGAESIGLSLSRNHKKAKCCLIYCILELRFWCWGICLLTLPYVMFIICRWEFISILVVATLILLASPWRWKGPPLLSLHQWCTGGANIKNSGCCCNRKKTILNPSCSPSSAVALFDDSIMLFLAVLETRRWTCSRIMGHRPAGGGPDCCSKICRTPVRFQSA